MMKYKLAFVLGVLAFSQGFSGGDMGVQGELNSVVDLSSSSCGCADQDPSKREGYDAFDLTTDRTWPYSDKVKTAADLYSQSS